MGLGLYEDGSGISATKFLLSRGAKVTVTDLKSKTDLVDQIKRLGMAAKKVKFVLGEHREQDFTKADLIIKNPAIPRHSKYLKIARDNKIPIESDITLFFKLADKKKIIAVTGTRGKSTTTTLINEILSAAKVKTILGGNITKSPLTQINQAKGRVVVLELSSWMLETLGEHRLSPHLAVFTNIYPDHLNTYDDINDYAKAKENIFAWQNLQDYVILNRDNKFTREMKKRVPSRVFWFSLKEFKDENGCFVRNKAIWFRQDGREQKILNLSDIKIPGEHNAANVLAAVCAAGVYGVKSSVIKSAVKNFSGVPNRLELLREIGGVKYYNDTTATTPEAGMAALRALSQKHKNTKTPNRIVLIAGGADKGLDFKEWKKEVKNNCKALVLLSGTGTEKLKSKFGIQNLKLEISEAGSMADAVGLAKSFAKAGDVILLSPSFASFGMFKNEFDRGDQFRKIIKTIK